MLARPTGHRRGTKGDLQVKWLLAFIVFAALPAHAQKTEKATFAAGCFWCTEVTFDPAKVSYERLLDVFWLNHDPTVTNRQFCDSGTQYRPEIFYHSEEQK